MTVLFDKIDLSKDKFILSKGWAAASLYYFLWKKGKITEEELNSYCGKCSTCKGEGYLKEFTCGGCSGTGTSRFIGLAEPIHSDIPFAGGSMGYGLPAAVGFALSKKLKGEEGNVYCLMSDGEMQIGTTWESALIAAHHKLNNLIVIVDNNRFQAMGETNKILETEFPYNNWVSFEINGHNYEEILQSLSFTNYPKVVIANTIKGKGVSFMENNNIWHYKAPNEEEYNLALKELNEKSTV